MFKSLTLKKFLPFALVIVVLVSIIGSGLYFYNQQRNNTQDAKAADSNQLTSVNPLPLCPLAVKDGVAQHVCEKPLNLNLIVATSTSTDYNTWSPLSYSNNSQFTPWTCDKNNPFDGKKVLGIVDYEDGISSVVLKRTNTTREDNRNCFLENSLANNIDGNCTYINNLKTEEDVLITRRCSQTQTNTFVPANNPVYAFQYKFEYTFPSDKKTTESDKFRSFTNKIGVYDGVTLTYTYYTYKGTNGNYKQWEVPTKDNKWGGWLIYGVGGNVPQTDKEVTISNLTGNPDFQIGHTVKFNYIDSSACPINGSCPSTGLYYSGTLKNGGSNGCSALEQNQLVKENGKYILKYKVSTKALPDQGCTQAFKDIPISGNLRVVLTDSELANYNGLFEVKNELGTDQIFAKWYSNIDFKTINFTNTNTNKYTEGTKTFEVKYDIVTEQAYNQGCPLGGRTGLIGRVCYNVFYQPSLTATGITINDKNKLFELLGPVGTNSEKAAFLNFLKPGFYRGVANIDGKIVIKKQTECSANYKVYWFDDSTIYNVTEVADYSDTTQPILCE